MKTVDFSGFWAGPLVAKFVSIPLVGFSIPLLIFLSRNGMLQHFTDIGISPEEWGRK